ncbi:MAG: hypothetical protein QXD62_01970 [Candidatus Woesearchaeota archaeon]
MSVQNPNIPSWDGLKATEDEYVKQKMNLESLLVKAVLETDEFAKNVVSAFSNEIENMLKLPVNFEDKYEIAKLLETYSKIKGEIFTTLYAIKNVYDAKKAIIMSQDENMRNQIFRTLGYNRETPLDQTILDGLYGLAVSLWSPYGGTVFKRLTINNDSLISKVDGSLKEIKKKMKESRDPNLEIVYTMLKDLKNQMKTDGVSYYKLLEDVAQARYGAIGLNMMKAEYKKYKQ